MSLTYESLRRFRDDPDDKRHGTVTGYNYGCRCDACREAGLERNRANREKRRERLLEKCREDRAKEKKPKPRKKRKQRKDVCTVPEFLRPLMGKPNVDNADGCCCWCGAPGATNRHHIVKRSSGTWIKDGREVRKPTVRLCGEGNASGCHRKAHDGLLHFRFVEVKCNTSDRSGELAPYGSGHWEGQEFDEPIKQAEALQIEKGWRKL